MKLHAVILTLALAGTLAFADTASDTATDIAVVRANEVAFNQAQNEGRFDDMFNFMLPTRTVFPTSGARMLTGWSPADVQRRKDDLKAGRQSNLQVEDLQVQVFGDTAIATFYRTGTEKAAGEPTAKPAHYRFTGIWLRTKDGWKLAHRHESPLTAQ